MNIQLPVRLNGMTFYNEVLPKIYKHLLQGETQLDFDMTDTQLANPEGLVNLLTACSLIKNRYNYIPYLEIPDSENLLLYLDLCNFFSIAEIPNYEVLRFKRIHFFKNEKNKHYIPQINIISPSNSSIYEHQTTVSKIFKYLRKQYPSDKSMEFDEVYDNAENSLNQLIRNVIEHNSINNNFASIGYYMMQRMPYDVIEIVCSDIGKGFRARILEMIEEGKDENINFYKPNLSLLKDNTFLFKAHDNNPNKIAINLAVRYRENSNIPGLAYIKKFVLFKSGSIYLHSGNYTIKYDTKGIQSYFYDSHFVGCHLKIEIPVKKRI